VTDRTQHNQGADDPLAVARDLLARNIMPLPVLPTEKNPILPEWQNLTITATNVDHYFNGASFNVGGRMGAKSGGLTDIDLDCPEALILWKHFLPPTSSRYGRADLLVAWSDAYGTGFENRVVLRDVIEAINETRSVDQSGTRVFAKPALRNAVLATMPQQRQPDVKAFGLWLRGRKNRIVGGMWFTNKSESHGSWWWVDRQGGQPCIRAM
jgi:hypothetical protein